MPAYGIIYLVRNKTTGKVYIGRTTQPLALRWAGHVHDSKGNVSTGLHGAIKRQGPDAFAVEEIEAYPDRATLLVAERDAIDRYKSRDPNVGYNIVAGYKEGGDAYIGTGRGGKELRNKVLKVRVTGTQLEAMVTRACADGRTVSDWARIQLEKALSGTTTMVATESVAPVVVATEPSLSSSGGADAYLQVLEGGTPEPGDEHASVLPELVPLHSSEGASPSAPVSSSIGDDMSWLDEMTFDLG